MISRDEIVHVLRTIDDPEMPVSIVDLGLVEHVHIEPQAHTGDACVSITILPTFVGCPALDMIRREIESKVGATRGIARVVVDFVHDPPWSVDRITPAGRASLKAHGVTVPAHGSWKELSGNGHNTTVALRTSAIACPYCNSTQTQLESSFGPTRCRMIYYCQACRNSFEHMKRVSG
jgi:ring-1,2-phenylacetyl-CoA epoxidase subunit PaaD